MKDWKIINIPNIISLSRLFLVIIFLILFYYDKIYYSLIILAFSAITDLLDGFLARMLKQQTPFGSFLDPLADKIFIITTFTIFMIKNYIPWWFFSIVIVREILVSSGWVIVYQYKAIITTRPRFSGKISIFFQMTTIIVVIFSLYSPKCIFSSILNSMFFVTSLLAIVSMIDYIVYGRKIYRGK